MNPLVSLLINKYDVHKLLAKLGGVGGSFVASHLVALTATDDYAHFWAHFYLSAPKITDVPAFEKMIAVYFSMAWLVAEHFYWRLKGQAAEPPKTA